MQIYSVLDKISRFLHNVTVKECSQAIVTCMHGGVELSIFQGTTKISSYYGKIILFRPLGNLSPYYFELENISSNKYINYKFYLLIFGLVVI